MENVFYDIVLESWSVLGKMAPYLLFGFLAAGILSVCISPEFVQRHLGGRGFGPVWKAALWGVPLPLCSCGVIPVSASVPIAAGLMHLGASPGTALAFLIAGPATNAATIATIWKLLGRRTAGLYLLTIALSAVGGGLLLDWLFSTVQATVPCMAEHTHEMMAGSWAPTFWAILLLAVLVFSYAAKPRHEEES